MNPKTSREGYLLIDHRAGPGMPAGFIEQSGIPARGGSMVEMATLTCAHCRGLSIKNPWRQRERGYCAKCDAYICDSCVAIAREPDYQHLPFSRVIDLVKEGKAIVVGGTHGRPQLLYL